MKSKTLNVVVFTFIIISSIYMLIFFNIPIFLTWLTTVFGILASKFASEGKWSTFVFDIFSYIIYIYICLKEHYFGEMILSYIVILCHLYGIMEWNKNKTNDIVKINIINKKEHLVVTLISIISFILYLIFLSKINSNFAFINAISTISFLIGNYFSYRRSIFQFYFWNIYEIFYIILWLIPALHGDIEKILLLLGATLELFYNISGIKIWKSNIKILKEKINIQSISYN